MAGLAAATVVAGALAVSGCGSAAVAVAPGTAGALAVPIRSPRSTGIVVVVLHAAAGGAGSASRAGVGAVRRAVVALEHRPVRGIGSAGRRC